MTPSDDKQTQADRLVDLAIERYRLGRSQTGEPFAVRLGGPAVARMLRSARGGLRTELAAMHRERYGRSPRATSLADALVVLEGRALAERPEWLSVRVAGRDGRFLLDLGRQDGLVVSIDAGGWRIESAATPVWSRTPQLTGELPLPISGGDLGALRELLAITDEAWPLLLAWLVAALVEGIGHPILLISGSQDAGKSTTARMLARLVDPSAAPLRSVPRDEEQWAVTASKSWVVPLDNVSSIPPWLSDALCRAVTGDGYVARARYTDHDVAVLTFRRLIIITSIEPGALRGDLGSRMLMIETESISDDRRRAEAELEAAFFAAWPSMLGGLLDLMVAVLRAFPDVPVGPTGRLAEFETILAALDLVKGTRARETYRAQALRIAETVVEGSPVASAIVALFSNSGPGAVWSGTAEQLRGLLEPFAAGPSGRRPHGWPETARAIRACLERDGPALRKLGYDVELPRGPGGGNSPRLITITRR